MNKTYLIGIGIIGIIIVVVLFGRSLVDGDKIAEKNNVVEASSTVYSDSQTNSEGEVSITVAAINRVEWSFAISLETHSVDIKEDLTQVVVLVDEDGNEYKPINWTGDPPGGHHRKGVLSFGEITPIPRSVALLIYQIGGIDERKFEWTTQP